jgi:hypothetical protein
MKAGEALCPGHADAPAAPQPSAPVVACKAPEWCGYMIGDDEKRAAYLGGGDNLIGVLSTDERHRYCSVACRDAKLPPLAAQPAEVKPSATGKPLCPTCGRLESQHTNPLAHKFGEPKKAKPAEQPKPAAKAHDFSDPYCARRYEGAVVRLCVDCGTFETTPVRECGTVGPMWRVDFERWVGKKAAGILRDPAIPERIAKPQMAHSMGVEDPTLEDA